MLFLFHYLCLSYSIENTVNTRQVGASRVEYFECVNIVRLIDHEIRRIDKSQRHRPSPKTSNVNEAFKLSGSEPNFTFITQNFLKKCDTLKEDRKTACTNILTENNVKKIYDLIKQGQKHDFICTSIGYKKVIPSRSRIISKKTCTEIIDIIKNDFNKSNNLWNHHHPRINPVSKVNLLEGSSQYSDKFKFIYNRKGSSICKQFMGNPKYQQCLALSRIAISAADSQIKDGDSSESICNYLEENRFIQLTDQDLNSFSEARSNQRSNYRPENNVGQRIDNGDVPLSKVQIKKSMSRPKMNKNDK